MRLAEPITALVRDGAPTRDGASPIFVTLTHPSFARIEDGIDDLRRRLERLF